jgi:hypothetical protein
LDVPDEHILSYIDGDVLNFDDDGKTNLVIAALQKAAQNKT